MKENENGKKINKSFLKWAGNKFRVLEHILPKLPKSKRFIEPFAGSAAVYLNIQADSALICDLNNDLVQMYTCIQQDGKNFVDYCHQFFSPNTNRKDVFYEFRERFNASEDIHERAALLLYLNRHAFNGLVRFNSKGNYNVPFGKYKAPYFPRDELMQFYKKTCEIETVFCCQDFRHTLSQACTGDVIYCDPPYVPLSETSSFTAYAGNTFGVEEQRALAKAAQELSAKGTLVVLSNHDTPVTRELYKNAQTEFFSVQRFISCQGSNRNAAPEMLAVFGER